MQPMKNNRHVLEMVLAPGTALRALKLVLTYMVPYGVSTWTSIAKDLEQITHQDHTSGSTGKIPLQTANSAS